MNRLIRNTVLGAIVLMLMSGLAASDVLAQDQHGSDRAALLQLMGKLESALSARDFSAVDSSLMPNSRVVFQDTTVATGPAEIEAYFERMLGNENSVLSGLTVSAEAGAPATFLSDDIAVAHGTTNDIFEFRSGNTINLKTAWSTTVVRGDSGWRIAALHFSNNLFDNAVLNGAKQVAWYAAGAGFLVGILLMALLRRFRKH